MAYLARTFVAFIQLSIQERLGNVAMRLCRLPFQHPSLITWQPELLMQTIRFLLSQCEGDQRSNFAAVAVPLAQLATTMNVYPRLADVKHFGPASLELWNYMNQAEIFVLLCVFLQRVCRQLGPSQVKLDFKIEAHQRPAGMQPELSVIGAEPAEFEWRVEAVLVKNLKLSPANFRRTGTNEWFVVIEDIDRVMRQLPTEWRQTDFKPAPNDRGKRASSESRKSSSVSSSESSMKRKVLLATPPDMPTTSGDKVPQRSNIVSRPMPLAVSRPTSVLSHDIDDRAERRAIAMLPATSNTQLRPPAVCGLSAVSQSAAVSVAAPVIDFTVPPPRHYSSLPTSVAYPPQRNYPSSLHVHAARQNLASLAGPTQMVMPTGYSSAHIASNSMIASSHAPSAFPPMSPVSSSQHVAFSSAVFPAYTSAASPQVTMSTYVPPTQYSPYHQQPSSMQLPTFQSPLVTGSRMTTAGSFRRLC